MKIRHRLGYEGGIFGKRPVLIMQIRKKGPEKLEFNPDGMGTIVSPGDEFWVDATIEDLTSAVKDK